MARVGGDTELNAIRTFRRQVMLFKANINGEYTVRHCQRMHAVGDVLAEFLSVMLTDFMQLLRCGQRLFMMQVHRQRKGFLRVSLIVKLLLLFQQSLIVARELFRRNMVLTRQGNLT